MLSIETLIDLSTLSLEDVTRHLKVVQDRIEKTMMIASGKLLLTEKWATHMRKRQSGEGSSGSSSHDSAGKRRSKAPQKKKKDGGDALRPLDKDTSWLSQMREELGLGLQ
jgi:hypothetical protein